MKSILKLMLCIPILLSINADAQRFTKRKQYFSGDISYITSYYRGNDIKFKENKILTSGFGLNFQKRKAPRVTIGLNYSYQVPRAKKEQTVYHENNICSYQDVVKYKNQIHSFGTYTMIDLFENRGTFLKRPDYTPYFYLGGEIAYFNQKLKRDNKYINIQNQFEKASFTFPVGVGFRIKTGRQSNIAIEFINYFSMSTDIDINFINDNSKSQKDQWVAFKIRIG